MDIEFAARGGRPPEDPPCGDGARFPLFSSAVTSPSPPGPGRKGSCQSPAAIASRRAHAGRGAKSGDAGGGTAGRRGRASLSPHRAPAFSKRRPARGPAVSSLGVPVFIATLSLIRQSEQFVTVLSPHPGLRKPGRNVAKRLFKPRRWLVERTAANRGRAE